MIVQLPIWKGMLSDLFLLNIQLWKEYGYFLEEQEIISECQDLETNPALKDNKS